MHPNCLVVMRSLLDRFVRETDRSFYDVGSRDVNGTLRPMIETDFARQYRGLDIFRGPNVDHVVPEFGQWPLPPCDFVVSANTLEHVRRPWEWIRQVAAVLKPDGRAAIVTPRHISDHRQPVDCWRILPDGMESLLILGGFVVLDVGTIGMDTFGVGELV